MRNALFFIALFFIKISWGQSGWFWLNPLPQGNTLNKVSYVNNSLVYVSGKGGSLIKSTNGGLNFTLISTGIFDDLSLTFMNELTGFSPAWGGGILRTTNGGNNWQYFQINSQYNADQISIVGTAIYTLLIKYQTPYDYSLIYKSTNLGETWILSLSPDSNTTIYSFHFPDNNTGYAVGNKTALNQLSKIYKTANGGLSWDTIASSIKYQLRHVYFMNSNTGFVTTYLRGMILKTINSCLSWDTVYTLGEPSRLISFFNNNEGYVKRSWDIVITSNSGLSWIPIHTYYNTTLFNLNDGLGIDPYDNNFLYRTTNSGYNWQQVTQGFNDEFFDITFINDNTGFTAGFNKIYKTTDAGLNWNIYNLNIQGWPPWVENIMFVNDNTGYAGIDGGRVAKTTNCGNNWLVYETGSGDHNHGMSFPSADTGYAVTKIGYYLKTTNGGVNWINFGQQPHHFGDVYFINNNTGFAGGYANGGLINRTTNGGLNWSPVEFDSVSYFSDVCVSSQSTWFAAGSGYFNGSAYPGYIYRSLDAGLTWTHLTFPNQIASIYFPTQLTGYASSYNNVMYKTTNGGDSWVAIRCINFDPSYGIWFTDNLTGYAVGYNGQIIKTTTGGGEPIGIQLISSEFPKSFLLYQNYPNPFNPVTKIRFEIPKSSYIKLIIYDILGREVSTLINENLSPGVYEAEWNANDYTSGVYFYKIITGDYSETKKMVLLK